MDRHTESFICLSLFVILLQNTARSASEECTHSYSEAPGNISELMDSNYPTYMCRYHVKAPHGHYIRLNVTGLVGVPQVSDHECSPKLVIKNIGEHGQTKLDIICNQGTTLPSVVQSIDNEIRIVFRSLVRQNSSFNATFTFHKKTAKPDPPSRPTRPMELLVLVFLAPVTLVCICCVIMYYRRRTSQQPQQTQRLPSTPPLSTASHAPLLSSPHSNTRNFPSSIHHQQTLRQQRETICRRSESTEKFPSSVALPDEEESSTMRNIVLNPDLCRDNGGIRPPPNRTVFDSESFDSMMSERSRQHQSPRVSPQLSVPRINPLLRTESSSRSATSRDIIDSVTQNPLQFGDSDSEGPPPYICVKTSIQPSNIGNVCEPQHFITNSAAAATSGHQVRHPGRERAHLQHARHPPVPLSPHFELDADQERRVDTVNRLERSDHETTGPDAV